MNMRVNMLSKVTIVVTIETIVDEALRCVLSELRVCMRVSIHPLRRESGGRLGRPRVDRCPDLRLEEREGSCVLSRRNLPCSVAVHCFGVLHLFFVREKPWTCASNGKEMRLR